MAASPHSNMRAMSGLTRWTLKPSGHANAELSGEQSPKCVEHIDPLPLWGKDMCRSSVKIERDISRIGLFSESRLSGLRCSQCYSVGGFSARRNLHSSGHRLGRCSPDNSKRDCLALQQCRDDMGANSVEPKLRNEHGNAELSVRSFNLTKRGENIYPLPHVGKDMFQTLVKAKNRLNLHADHGWQGQGHLVPCLSEV